MAEHISFFSPEHPDRELLDLAIAGDQLAVATVVAKGYWILVSPAVKPGGKRKVLTHGQVPDVLGGLVDG